MKMEMAVQAAQMVSTIGRNLLPKATIMKAPMQMAQKIRSVWYGAGAQSGWYMAAEAEIREAKPKLTDRVIVQFPMSQIHLHPH